MWETQQSIRLRDLNKCGLAIAAESGADYRTRYLPHLSYGRPVTDNCLVSGQHQTTPRLRPGPLTLGHVKMHLERLEKARPLFTPFREMNAHRMNSNFCFPPFRRLASTRAWLKQFRHILSVDIMWRRKTHWASFLNSWM